MVPACLEQAALRGKYLATVDVRQHRRVVVHADHIDVPLDEAELLELAATLKQRCGTGGTVKDGRIEIQGDQRERLAAVLEGMGYRVKRVGG